MELFDVYSLFNIEPVRGKGCHVYTADGTEYLDLYGGHAVISIGHAVPRYTEAIARQVRKLGFYSNSVINSLQAELAHKLGKASGYQDYSLFLCNSGAEANENALKLASFSTGRSKVLSFNGAFHGRTSGAVAATDNVKIISPFNTTDHIEFCESGNITRARALLSTESFAAVIIEGIQGVAGIRMHDERFLNELAQACKDTGTMLILDEIQSGYGRTGKFFAHQHYGIKPDIITCAKGIANGFPMGAVLISPALKPVIGMLGTTFGGNHLACAAAIAVLDEFEEKNLIENAATQGHLMMEKLKEIPWITDIRGKGLMVGFDIPGDALTLRKELLFDHKIFTGGAGKHTIRILPPLCISSQETDTLISALKKLNP